MSVKRAIHDLIPNEWYEVLSRNRVLTKAANYIYRDAVPSNWKNKVMYKRSIERIKHLVTTCPFIDCFNANNTEEGFEFWRKIDSEINNHKEYCR